MKKQRNNCSDVHVIYIRCSLIFFLCYMFLFFFPMICSSYYLYYIIYLFIFMYIIVPISYKSRILPLLKFIYIYLFLCIL